MFSHVMTGVVLDRAIKRALTMRAFRIVIITGLDKITMWGDVVVSEGFICVTVVQQHITGLR